MSDPVEFLDLDDVLGLAQRLLGQPPPIRDVGLLVSAVARPQTTVGGSDAYPTVWLKAAALLQSIVDNHALVDGNKRLGWLATAVFREINGASVSAAPNDDVDDLVRARIAAADAHVTCRNVEVRADVAIKLSHEALAETHNLSIATAFWVEVRTTFTTTHRKSS